MKANLSSDLVVKHLVAESKQYYCMSDNKAEKGFGVLVYPTGSKTFIYRYKIDGAQRLLVLGEYPTTRLKDARDSYLKAVGQVKDLRRGSKDGIDPVVEKKLAAERRIAEELERKRQFTFDELAREYIENNVAGQVVKKSEYDIKRVLLGTGKAGCIDDFREWRKRKASAITHEDASDLLKTVAKRSAAAARNIIKTARPMFIYAEARGITAGNPFQMAKVKTYLPKAVTSKLKATTKKRVLSEDEIKALWKALSGECHGSLEARNALRIMLLLGQRPTEILGLVSSEITSNWWILPRERTKARLDEDRTDHTVYLVPEALALIGKKQGHIFGYAGNSSNTSEEQKHITVGAIGKMIRRNSYFGLAPWGAHDLRRTVRTFMEDMDGISVKAAEAVLSHAQVGTERNYNLHDYKRQIENALTLWRDKLIQIIGEPLVKALPENVVSIQQGRKKAVNN